MRPHHALLLLLLLLGNTPAWSIDPVQFDDPAPMERYKKLIAAFRCLQCQNQNLIRYLDWLLPTSPPDHLLDAVYKN